MFIGSILTVFKVGKRLHTANHSCHSNFIDKSCADRITTNLLCGEQHRVPSILHHQLVHFAVNYMKTVRICDCKHEGCAVHSAFKNGAIVTVANLNINVLRKGCLSI